MVNLPEQNLESSDATKRTATDVLLSIESKLVIMEKRIQNSENLLKILLSRMNGPVPGHKPVPAQHIQPVTGLPNVQPGHPPIAHAQSTQPSVRPGVINKDNFESRPKTSKFADLAASKGVVVAKPSSFSPDPSGDDMIEAPVRGNIRNQRGPTSNGKRASVSQIIKREDDTPLFIANVKVLDENGTVINQTRTNKNGRWLMALTPGSYQVHVLKTYPADSGKTSVDTMYSIEVPLSDKPLELDPLVIS